MRTAGVFCSCAAMYSATLVGLAFGELAGRQAPLSAGCFLLCAAASIICLTISAFGLAGPAPTGRPDVSVPRLCLCLATLAALLITLDFYRHVSLSSVGLQLVSVLPFLGGIGHFARRGDWLAACGSAGFFATAVAMLHTNSRGGWTGFFCVYSA